LGNFGVLPILAIIEVCMAVVNTATAKIEEHQREIVKAENSHRTATGSTRDGVHDKSNRLN
jgi:hypothetical protein